MTRDARLVLDAQHRRIIDLDAEIDALLIGASHEVGGPPAAATDYDDIVARSAELRTRRGWDGLLAAPEPTPARRAWNREDHVVAGLAGALGFAAAWYDAPIDAWVRDRLTALSHTGLIKRWESEAKLYAIDFAQRGYGGPNHRVRGSGHDLLRAVAALRQIRQGAFEGARWVGKELVREMIPCAIPVESLGEALILWLKHLATDVITDRSLPLPGWTWLNELPWEGAQQLARAVYMGDQRGAVPGLTLRSGALATLPVLSTEVIVRAHVHGRALRERGTASLTRAEAGLRDEMLLAAHGITGAASLGRTLTQAFVAAKGPLALRHANVPVFLRVGTVAWTVVHRHAEELPTWAALAERIERPWDLRIAQEIDDESGSSG